MSVEIICDNCGSHARVPSFMGRWPEGWTPNTMTSVEVPNRIACTRYQCDRCNDAVKQATESALLARKSDSEVR